ncbi:MliC family protein [Patescibacteria group bacterium]|nr:MliC family protein [Patescibacteria group bacterium]
MKKTIFWIIVLGAVALIVFSGKKPQQPASPAAEPVASAMFACDAGKTIDAAFYAGSSTPATAGEPPVPGGSVSLVLSDGRSMTLPQTISADGGRYADASGSIVFWNVGDTATLAENGTTTYTGCIATTTTR